tara:strand:+ start:291 stop:1127 length:837 start_codon:yes stop_codon:yes gene_type:complete
MPEYLKKGDEIDVTKFGLGTFIVKFEMPMNFIDDINEIYGGAKNLPKHNQNLAGKIEDELKVSDILTDDMKNCFLACFRQYLQLIQKPFWHCELAGAWINDMKAGEYNPFHFHQSSLSYLGLSSVLVLQRPSTYGKEYSREESPSNGWLEFNGGQQDPLSIPQLRQDAQVGSLYIFPYTLLHGVYPFNGTDEIRRTLSYNCDLLTDPQKQMKDLTENEKYTPKPVVDRQWKKWNTKEKETDLRNYKNPMDLMKDLVSETEDMMGVDDPIKPTIPKKWK